jgi:hypothetical protein
MIKTSLNNETVLAECYPYPESDSLLLETRRNLISNPNWQKREEFFSGRKRRSSDAVRFHIVNEQEDIVLISEVTLTDPPVSAESSKNHHIHFNSIFSKSTSTDDLKQKSCSKRKIDKPNKAAIREAIKMVTLINEIIEII